MVVYKNKILAASISYKTGEEALSQNSSHKKTEAKGEKKEWHSQTSCELSTNAIMISIRPSARSDPRKRQRSTSELLVNQIKPNRLGYLI